MTLKDAKPTIFFGVPRVWEKMQEKILQGLGAKSFIERTVFAVATKAGYQRCMTKQYGKRYTESPSLGYRIADRLVLHKLKTALGLAATHTFFTGAAPISMETLRFFASLDMPLFEVYGLSESTGPHTLSTGGEWKLGYCGRPSVGKETKLDPTSGELCMKGRHIFMGYLYMRDETASVFDADGFFRTGDIATLDECNHPEIPPPSRFLRVTGRIKELLITASGENVNPVLIEHNVKECIPVVSNCIVIGDKRKFLTILFTVKVALNDLTGEPTNILSAETIRVGRKFGSTACTVAEMKSDELWTNYFNDGIAAANNRSGISVVFVKKWRLLPNDFSERTGELTTTLKLRRNFIVEKYQALIEEMYADEEK